MAQSLPSSGAGAVRIILKNKEDFHADLRKKEETGTRKSYLYDVFYVNAAGTFNIIEENGDIKIATLNLNLGKVITLDNDANLKKLAKYVLESTDVE